MQPIEDCSTDDDGGTVLIVMENRNLHPFAQFFLDVEALRRLDVFKIDTAESRLQRGDDFDQHVRIALLDFDVEHVNIGELLEQHALAFHHRLGCQRADRAKAKHGGAIGDDADQIGARSQRADFSRIGDDFLTGCSDARRIRHRQIVLVGQLLGRLNRNLARLGVTVIVEGGGAKLIIIHGSLSW